MFFSKERRENEDDGKRSSGTKNMSHHKNKKYVRNLKQPLYNNKYINKFQKRNKDLKTKRGGNANYVYNNVSTDINNNNKSNQFYFNKNLINRNNKETQNRTNVYKKNYFNNDNINYNSLINTQTPVCSIHIDKTDEEVKKQLQYTENLNSPQYNNSNNESINESSNFAYPTFVEEILFTTNIVLFTGILILPPNDKIFHNSDFEGKTNPLPNECNLNIYINVVNKYDSQYFKQLLPVSYNFKGRLFYAVSDNNSVVDSTLLIDKIIIKGNFKTLSLIVLGQPEEISEPLRYHRENLYDINMKTKINEATVDVENVEAEKDDIYSPKKPVYIKTYNIANLMEENYDFEKKHSINDHKNYENSQIYELNELSTFSNILEEDFVRNNVHQINKNKKNDHRNNNSNNIDDNAKPNENEKAEETEQNKENANKSDQDDLDKSWASDSSDSSTETDSNQFIPPDNELIIKILNCLTNLYKKKKEINRNDLPIYKKIIKFGAMWLFYIYKNIKADEDNFLFNYSNYTQIKIYDILGCLLVLRRCALYPNLAKYIIHIQVNSNLIQIDRKHPHILIYLIDILSIDGVYFLSSWKIKTSILKTIIALISDYYVMSLFCNYVDENNETLYTKLLALSSNKKMKRYNIKRLLGIIICRVKLYDEINKFENSVMDIITHREDYKNSLFNENIISKLIYELKNIHKELYQHSCNPESKNSCYDIFYENEIFINEEYEQNYNYYYTYKLHNYMLSYLEKSQFFNMFLYILKEFEKHIKNILFLNSYDISFITTLNDFIFYFLNCSGGINLLVNYNIEMYKKTYINICLIINKKMKQLNSNINNKNEEGEDADENDKNSVNNNNENFTNINEENNDNEKEQGENESNNNYDFDDPYNENKQNNINSNINQMKNSGDTEYISPENNNSTFIQNKKDEDLNKETINNLNEKKEKKILYNEKNFFYDNLKCVYTYNDILRNKDISDIYYLNGYNYKDMKNTRNSCSYVLCSIIAFYKSNLLINNFFKSEENISLDYLKIFSVLSAYPLFKSAMCNNTNILNFLIHLTHLLYYFIYLEKQYEESNPSNSQTIKFKKNAKDGNTNSVNLFEGNQLDKSETNLMLKNAKNKFHKKVSNEYILVAIKYILSIIYNLIFYDNSGYFIFHSGYSIFVCLEEIKNLTGEIKKNKDYYFGTLNCKNLNKFFLKDYISNDKILFKKYFIMYENLKGLYTDLYKYEKQKFNEMDIQKRKDIHKNAMLEFVRKYDKSSASGENNKYSNSSLIDNILSIYQENPFFNFLPLKSCYTPNVCKIIEALRIEKDKYILKKSKELNNYNCKLNNDIYISNSSKSCTRLGTNINDQYIELLEEFDDNIITTINSNTTIAGIDITNPNLNPLSILPTASTISSGGNNANTKTGYYPILPLNLLYYYMNLCPNISYFSNLYKIDNENESQHDESEYNENTEKDDIQDDDINNENNKYGLFFYDNMIYNNYICIKNCKLDEKNKPIASQTNSPKFSHQPNSHFFNEIDKNYKKAEYYLKSINYINKYDENNYKNIGSQIYLANNLEFIIKLINKSIFFLNINTLKLALINFNKLSGRNLCKIIKNRLKTLDFVKSILNILFNFFYNLTAISKYQTIAMLKSYRNHELFYSLLYLLNKLLSFNDWIGSNNISEYNHHSSIFTLRYNIIYILRIFYLWFNNTSDNQSFLLRSILRYTRIMPSFNVSGMLLLLIFFDFKNIFPEYIYSFYLSKNLKNICYDNSASISQYDDSQIDKPDSEDSEVFDSPFESETDAQYFQSSSNEASENEGILNTVVSKKSEVNNEVTKKTRKGRPKKTKNKKGNNTSDEENNVTSQTDENANNLSAYDGEEINNFKLELINNYENLENRLFEKSDHLKDGPNSNKDNRYEFSNYSKMLNNNYTGLYSDTEADNEKSDTDNESCKDENFDFSGQNEYGEDDINNNGLRKKKLEQIILYCKIEDPYNVPNSTGTNTNNTIENDRNVNTIENRTNIDKEKKMLYMCCSINTTKRIINDQFSKEYRVLNLNFAEDEYENTFYFTNYHNRNTNNYLSYIGNLNINFTDLKDVNVQKNSNLINKEIENSLIPPPPNTIDPTKNIHNSLDNTMYKNYIGNNTRGISFLSSTKVSIKKSKNKFDNSGISTPQISPYPIQNFLTDNELDNVENIFNALRNDEHIYDEHINIKYLKKKEKEKVILIKKELKNREYINFEDICDYINFILRIGKSNNVISRCLSAHCCVVFINHRIPIFSILFKHIEDVISNLISISSFNQNEDDDNNTTICMNKINYFSFYSYNNSQSNSIYYTYNQELYILKELCNLFCFVLDVLKICFFNNYKNSYNKLIKILYLPSNKLLNIIQNLIIKLKNIFPQELIRFIIKITATIFQGYIYVFFLYFTKHTIMYNQFSSITTSKQNNTPLQIDKTDTLFIHRDIFIIEKQNAFLRSQKGNTLEESETDQPELETKSNNKMQEHKQVFFSCPNYIKYIKFFFKYYFDLINTKNIVNNNNKDIIYKYSDYINLKTVTMSLSTIYEMIKNKVIYFFIFFKVEKKLENLFFKYIQTHKDESKIVTLFTKVNNQSVQFDKLDKLYDKENDYIHTFNFFLKLNKHINISNLIEFFSFYFDIIQDNSNKNSYKIIELYEYLNIIDIILNIIIQIINYNFNSLFILIHLFQNNDQQSIKLLNRINQMYHICKIEYDEKDISTNVDLKKFRQKYFKSLCKFAKYILNFKRNFLSSLLNTLRNLYQFILNTSSQTTQNKPNNEPTSNVEPDLLNPQNDTENIIDKDKTTSLIIFANSILTIINKLEHIKTKVLNLDTSYIPNITFKNFLLFICYDLDELHNLYKDESVKRKTEFDSVPNENDESVGVSKRRKMDDDGNGEAENSEVDNEEVEDGEANNGNESDSKEEETANLTECKDKPEEGYTLTKNYSFYFEKMYNDRRFMINNRCLFNKLCEVFYSKPFLNKVTKAYESHQHLDNNYLTTIKNINLSNFNPSLNKKLYDYSSHLFSDILSKIYLYENDEDKKSFTLFNLSQQNKSKEIDQTHSLYNYINILKEEYNKIQKKKNELLSLQLSQAKTKQYNKRTDKNAFEDHFRNRKTISSRAPSKHVDDYEAEKANANQTTANNENENEQSDENKQIGEQTEQGISENLYEHTGTQNKNLASQEKKNNPNMFRNSNLSNSGDMEGNHMNNFNEDDNFGKNQKKMQKKNINYSAKTNINDYNNDDENANMNEIDENNPYNNNESTYQNTQNTSDTNESVNKASQFEDCTCYKFTLLGWKEFSEDGHKNDLDVCKIVNKPTLLKDPRIKMKFLRILDRHKNIKDIFKKLGVDIK
ncbi:conserved Plasmodium protein, unknown function [Plasmodium vinckei brucechwatti]|uniref:Uncharacterized protein n=1 Tax=Plasmodium vinckei brucechwatti TaxID=119398 RepID=A0A6V7SEY7_PLAVN|nr:conserved Plasmodium protein, unknown function [Plasmodium vinckei brucechwatti]